MYYAYSKWICADLICWIMTVIFSVCLFQVNLCWFNCWIMKILFSICLLVFQVYLCWFDLLNHDNYFLNLSIPGEFVLTWFVQVWQLFSQIYLSQVILCWFDLLNCDNLFSEFAYSRWSCADLNWSNMTIIFSVNLCWFELFKYDNYFLYSPIPSEFVLIWFVQSWQFYFLNMPISTEFLLIWFVESWHIFSVCLFEVN